MVKCAEGISAAAGPSCGVAAQEYSLSYWGRNVFTNRRTILHIDDDPSFTPLVADFLQEGGYEVDALHDPLQAIPTLQREQYRVVLLDIDMPEKSGMHLLSEIKGLDGGIQVIMLTEVVNINTVLESLRCGAEACIFKPFGQDNQLMDAVTDCFRKIDRWWGSFRDLTQRRQVSLAGGRVETLL